MKKSIFSKILALTLCLVLALSSLTVNVFAINEDADLDMGDDVIIQKATDVWLSSSGSDSNDGKTQSTPFKTLNKATYAVADGGTIHIVGTYTVDSSNVWSSKRPNANITVTGGTLALSADLVIGSNTTFKNITINGGKSLYANGKSVTFDTGVTATDVTVYGGNSTGEALESTNITINGGTLGTVYGGGSANCTINQVNLTVNGGTINSIFGGNNSSSLTGNVTVQLLGGTFNDRIFGGCNNEYTYKNGYLGTIGASITWNTAYYVSGKVDVIVNENASINTNNSSGKDKAFFAHSRHKTLSANENTSIIFLSSTAFNNNSSKLGTKTSKGSVGTSNTLAGAGMGTTTADSADNVHVHAATADDTNDTITENCTAMTGTACSNSNSVTLTLIKTSVYTGEELTPMAAVVTGELSLGEPVITYTNNVMPGTATATMTYAGLSVSKNFTIAKQTQKVPNLTYSNETISGKADGEIYGLATKMEISTDGTTFTPITNTDTTFAAGTYYVRYAETETAFASDTVTVVIVAGKKLIVKYVADGKVVSEQALNYGEDAVVPEIPAKEGYTETAPYWDIDATNVTTDLTINAVYTKDIPKITPADTNNDGAVNLKDLIALAQYVAGWQNTGAYVPALDINGDNEITLLDVNALAQYLAGWNVPVSTAPYLG